MLFFKSTSRISNEDNKSKSGDNDQKYIENELMDIVNRNQRHRQKSTLMELILPHIMQSSDTVFLSKYKKTCMVINENDRIKNEDEFNNKLLNVFDSALQSVFLNLEDVMIRFRTKPNYQLIINNLVETPV